MPATRKHRVRTPKEQAGNFIADIGGLLKTGKAETDIAARLSDLILDIASTKNPAFIADTCSHALSAWADVNRAAPDHAYQLGVLASQRTKNELISRSALERVLDLPGGIQSPTTLAPLTRKAIAPKARGL